MAKSSPKKVVVSKDGPYKVSGDVPLSMQIINPNKEGLSWDWKKAKDFKTEEEYDLCRCGHSKTKPFCDGSHAKVGFDGTETATRKPYVRQAEVFEGPSLLLSDAEDLCAFARFCDPQGKIWSVIEQPGAEARKLAIREANHCPAGQAGRPRQEDRQGHRGGAPSVDRGGRGPGPGLQRAALGPRRDHDRVGERERPTRRETGWRSAAAARRRTSPSATGATPASSSGTAS